MIGVISGKWVPILTVQNHPEDYPLITLNNVPFKYAQSHKHLGLTTGSKLGFQEHNPSIFPKVNKLTSGYSL